MSSLATLENPEAVAKLGEQIYAEKYRHAYERDYADQFAAIDINSGRAFVAPHADEAIETAIDSVEGCVLHLVRIGSASAYGMSFLLASSDAGLARPL